MPIVDVTHRHDLPVEYLELLAERLPDAASRAVECPEEPYDRVLGPGDVEICFRPRGSYDVSGLDLLVEVRSKWFTSRESNRQERCDQLRDELADLIRPLTVGVYLSLPVAAWSQVG
ncbi:hypothetical protein [Nocardioides dilutus]